MDLQIILQMNQYIYRKLQMKHDVWKKNYKPEMSLNALLCLLSWVFMDDPEFQCLYEWWASTTVHPTSMPSRSPLFKYFASISQLLYAHSWDIAVEKITSKITSSHSHHENMIYKFPVSWYEKPWCVPLNYAYPKIVSQNIQSFKNAFIFFNKISNLASYSLRKRFS